MFFTLPAPLVAPALILITAAGYAIMTVGMKATSSGDFYGGLIVALVGFGTAFVAEIVLMRRLDLSIVYVLIVTAETILVLGYAAWIGEGFGPRQMFGAGMVLVGLIAVTA